MNSQSTCLSYPSVRLEFQAYAIIFNIPVLTMFLRMPCDPGYLFFTVHPTTLFIVDSSSPWWVYELNEDKACF